MIWHGWPLSRATTVFVGIVFILIGIQVVLLHYRQNFRHWAMWLPVIGSPLLGVLAIILGVFNIFSMKVFMAILYSIIALAGLIGYYFHFTGVGNRVDGYRLQNFLVGPPIILPLLITAMGVLGIMALYWGD